MSVNRLKKIAGILIFSVMVSVMVPVLWSRAEEEEPPPPKAITECQEEFPDFTKEKPFTLPENSVASPLDFRVAFENARSTYHSYIECVIDELADEVLSASGADLTAFWSANAPNIPEWLKPDIACIAPDKLIELYDKSSIARVLPQLIWAYDQYASFQRDLYTRFNNENRTSDFALAVKQINLMEIMVKNEIQNAVVGLESGMKMYTGLRQALLMHIQFQCMMKYLEDYRVLLEKIRNIVELMPSRIHNASTNR